MNENKVIFLDFDGVINDYFTFDSVNDYNVSILKKIIEKTDATIVVTSSNKYAFQRNNKLQNNQSRIYTEYIKELNQKGIKVSGFTPYVNGNREDEILKYLEMHPKIEQYLIIDDDYIIESCKDHEIYLDLQSGLREKHLIPALNILEGNLSFYSDYENINETPEERCIRMNKKINECKRKKCSEDIER